MDWPTSGPTHLRRRGPSSGSPCACSADRALIVIISPLNAHDGQIFTRLRARGHEGLLVSPDPIDFGMPSALDDVFTRHAARTALLERRLALRRIARLGVRVIDWKVTEPLAPLVRNAPPNCARRTPLSEEPLVTEQATPHRLLFFLVTLAASACLAAAFWTAGHRIAASAAVLPGLLFSLDRKIRRPWAATVSLVCAVVSAAAALFLGAPAFLAILAAALSLAAWDLAAFARVTERDESPHAVRRLEIRHSLSLLQAISLGAALAAAGVFLYLPIPFAVMLVLAALDLFCLGRVYRILTREGAK